MISSSGSGGSNIKVFIAPELSATGNVGGIPRVIEAQIKYLPEYGIEVVNDNKHADILAMHAASWINKVPNSMQRTVSHCHGLYWSGYNWPSRWYQAINTQVLECIRQADAVTAPSKWVANAIRHGTWLNNVHVIGHGVDLDEWTIDREQTHDYILWDKSRVDAICDPKPVNVLAARLPKVKFRTTFGERTPNVEVIGETKYELHKQNIQNAMLYLATARETFGISIIEAMACGVPIIGWNWGGQADIVEHRVTGWLSPVGDYADLLKGIRYCIEHRDELSKIARQVVVDRYQWKHVIGQYAELYTQLEGATRTTSEPRPKVSVIMPSHNLSKYLPQAMNSVIEQDYKDYELVVVDDCSTDDSLEVATRISDGLSNVRMRVLKTPHNLYLSGALNYGISQSHGEYILPLDADNYLEQGTLNTLASELDAHNELDIVYGKVRFVLEDGSPDRSVSGDGISSWPPKEFSYDGQMSHRNHIPSSSMYRRKIFDRIGGYRARCRTAEDADFWCRATSFGARAARVTDAVTLVYRNREDSMSHTVQDWPWEAWYSWSSKPELTPYIADRDEIKIPIHEPKISFIVPVGLGHEVQGIQDALDSIYSQTIQDWECIVINDTGTNIPWLPSWVRLLNSNNGSSTSQGVSVARNIGLSVARGEFYVFLDADDYLDPEFLAKTIRAYKQSGGYVYTDFYRVGTSSTLDNQVVTINDFECIDQLHNLHHPITCLYPKQLLKLRFDERMRVGEDWDYILGVQAAGYCGTHVNEPLVYYRQVSGSNRQSLLKNIDTVRSTLYEKWSSKMGCGCSNGGGGVAIDNSASNMRAIQESVLSGDLVLLEFVKPMTPTMTWTGPVTGHQYRFGSELGHNIGYVHNTDAVEFLKRSEFVLADIKSVDMAAV